MGQRDWPHQSEPESRSRIDEHLSPYASALSPKFPLELATAALLKREASTLPAVTRGLI